MGEATHSTVGSRESVPEATPDWRCDPTSKTAHGGAVVGLPRLFAGIPPGHYARITAAARVKHYSRGEVLYFAGDSVNLVRLLTTGMVKITRFGESGAQVIVRLGVPGDVLGSTEMFASGKHGTTAQAFRASRVLLWEAQVFKQLAKQFPVLSQNIIRIMTEHLEEMEQRFREVSTEKVASRLARQMLRLAKQIGWQDRDAVVLALTREELAQMVGTTLFTVSRLLSFWESKGVIRAGREMVGICDFRSLRMISEDC